MARRAADLVHFDQQGIGIAVEVNRLHLLNIAALFTLAPQLVAAAAEVANFSSLCLLYTSPSPRDLSTSRMPSSA